MENADDIASVAATYGSETARSSSSDSAPLDDDNDTRQPAQFSFAQAQKHALQLWQRIRSVSFPLATYPSVYEPPARPTRCQLYVYGPWGHQRNGWASCDVDCLVWQAYLQFTLKTDYEVVLCNEPLMSPSGSLPFLVTEKGRVITSQDRFLRYIATKHHKPLDEAQQAQFEIYASLIENKLLPAILYNWWADDLNYPDQMLELYGRYYTPPLGNIVVWQKSRQVRQELRNRLGPSLNPEEIYTVASEALDALSTRLRRHKYFFGKEPTFLDALCFAHLHTILSSNFPNARLRQLVLKHDNLVEYGKAIWSKWFRNCDVSARTLKNGVMSPVAVSHASKSPMIISHDDSMLDEPEAVAEAAPPNPPLA
ncbi:hypothetical protein RI367_005458 [Sorochytrium milnesiophthora]